MVAENITFNYLDSIPVPTLREATSILVHLATTLLSNEDSYQDLVGEQIYHLEPIHLPVSATPSSRRDPATIRALIDAIVASIYGLRRADLEHVLSGFSHRTNPQAPLACLEAFDQLEQIGLTAFRRIHDPYWDIPLNENLPQPVLDLQIPVQNGIVQASLGPLFDSTAAAVAQAEIGMSTARTDPAQPAAAPAPSVRPSGNGAFATITELLCSCGVITSSDAQQATGLDAAGVRPHLKQLVQQGLAVTEGQRRGMRYRRVDG